MTDRLTIILLLTSINLFGQLDKRTYDVYSTIIKQEFELWEDTISNHVLIKNRTAGRQITGTIDRAIEVIETMQNGQPVFLRYADNLITVLEKFPQIGLLIVELKKKKSNELERGFDLKCTYKLISKRKFERLTKNDRLNEMREKDSKFFGIIEFSSVVFGGDYAVTYCGLYHGTMHAVGTIVILKKEGERWRIISRPEFWGT